MSETPPSPTVAPADGKLGILCVGLGAVTTTLIAGVELAKRGEADPVGSLTQLGTIRIGKRTDDNVPRIQDFVPLASLDQIVLGAWDPYPDDAYTAASRAGVLDQGRHLEGIADDLRAIRPMPAAFDPNYVKRLEGTNVMADTSKRAMLEQVRADIQAFRDEHLCDRMVMIWAGSTEIFIEPGPTHADLDVLRGRHRRRGPVDRPLDALRLRRPPGGRPLRQRRPQPGRRHARSCGPTPRSTASPSRARTSRRARPC